MPSAFGEKNVRAMLHYVPVDDGQQTEEATVQSYEFEYVCHKVSMEFSLLLWDVRKTLRKNSFKQ